MQRSIASLKDTYDKIKARSLVALIDRAVAGDKRALATRIIAAAVSEPEASERGSSLIGKKLHYRGIQSLFLTKRKELWLCATQRFRMRSRLARNCGYARMGIECPVDYHVLSSYTDFQLQFE